MEKLKIIFVDDEPAILQGMRRVLRSQRTRWEMLFFEGAQSAMEYMRQNRADAIVSDMRMPGINGVELLNWVKAEFPGMVRIALSGYADNEMTMQGLGAIHQFISKPAEPGQIENALARTLKLKKALNDDEVIRVINGIESIPSLPEVYDQFIKLLSKDDFHMGKIVEIIQQDVALSASILKVVNSAFFGFFGHVESPTQAVTLLGVQTVKNLALSEQVFRSYEQAVPKEKISHLNEYAQQIAGLANQLAKSVKMDKQSIDHCQMAGLLVVLGDLLALTELQDNPLVQSGEIKAELIAGHILSLWGLPGPVVEAVLFHREQVVGFENRLSPVHVVHAAWLLLEDENTAGIAMTEKALSQQKKLEAFVNVETAKNWVDIYTEQIQGT